MQEERTEEKMHGVVRPPAQQHEERHPPERELDAEVDRAPVGELGCERLELQRARVRVGVESRRRVRPGAVEGAVEVRPGAPEEVVDCDDAVAREGEDREENEAEPSARCQVRAMLAGRGEVKRRRKAGAHSVWMPLDWRTSSMLDTSWRSRNRVTTPRREHETE